MTALNTIDIVHLVSLFLLWYNADASKSPSAFELGECWLSASQRAHPHYLSPAWIGAWCCFPQRSTRPPSAWCSLHIGHVNGHTGPVAIFLLYHWLTTWGREWVYRQVRTLVVWGGSMFNSIGRWAGPSSKMNYFFSSQEFLRHDESLIGHVSDPPNPP